MNTTAYLTVADQSWQLVKPPVGHRPDHDLFLRAGLSLKPVQLSSKIEAAQGRESD